MLLSHLQYVLVIYKITFLLRQFPFWPVGAITLKCICTYSPMGRYAGTVRFSYVAHMCAVSPSNVTVSVGPLSFYCTDPQQMQKAMSLQGHEDWVRGVAWASRSEWGQRSCISHKSGRSAHKTLNAVFRNDQFCVHTHTHTHALNTPINLLQKVGFERKCHSRHVKDSSPPQGFNSSPHSPKITCQTHNNQDFPHFQSYISSVGGRWWKEGRGQSINALKHVTW